MKQKILIYQVLPRLFGNDNTTNKENGTLEENGVGKFSSFNNKALKEIKKMGFSHIWYTGVLEHATQTDYSAYGIAKDHPDVVKGIAGSPYAIKDYYDVSPDLADDVNNRMQEFEDLIERSHKNDLKVIIDFVPNHVAREYKSDAKPRRVKDFGTDDDIYQSFLPDNNFYYIPGEKLDLQFPIQEGEDAYIEYPAKATGNDCFSSKPTKNDWYETVKLNYGVDYQNGKTTCFSLVPDTWEKMKNILLFWTAKGVDGFRCDMAEMVPVEFWNWVIPKVKKKNKALLFIAEVYNPALYHSYSQAGFDYLYDKVDLYDTLRGVISNRRPTSDITFCWQRIDGLQEKMLNFLENHDEQRVASDYFAHDAQKAIPAMIIAATMNTNPVMVYFGQELGEQGMDKEGFSGQDGRTTIFDYWSVSSIQKWRNEGAFGTKELDSKQTKLRNFYTQLLKISGEESAITDGIFYDLMYCNYDNKEFDSTKQFAFLRSYKKELILIVTNFSDKATEISVNIPVEAFVYINLAPGKIKKATDLLSKKEIPFPKSWVGYMNLKLEAHSGKIIKFSLS